MKHMKKLIALALMAVTVLAVAVPVMAAVDGYKPYLGGDGSSHNIRRGHEGPQVTNLQLMLISAGYLPQGEDDGIFGGKTERAVKALQAEYRLRQDGIVGPKTKVAIWNKIGETAPNDCTIVYSQYL
ncbi:MAG TPA: peptidoglycan-binding protein [Chloroflexi bacterium]|nr:peptidoglycan-binding protein [Chloroflexota bacterium]